jgi:YdjC-like protein
MPGIDPASLRKRQRSTGGSSSGGKLIVNADDWGRDVETTDRILECVQCAAVSSASGMVFMEDSERAAALARERGVDIGLHLNLTTPFSLSPCSSRLLEHQARLSRYLRSNRFAQTLYHPGLRGSFEYVVKAQFEEFRRIYGAEPARVDGHHHMHICANVLLAGLLPAGTLVRRNFSFRKGEKSLVNRVYRKMIDGMLMRHHRLVDFLFPLPPVEPVGRLQRVFRLAHHYVVELETHPINPEEYRFLTSGDILRQTTGIPIANGFGACL